ncbi:hypothetical protein TWF696_009305 [Orbilia brochopaga]|uniref:Uncharacterized protein n=1 Tax=Orbilia brochopaga TaxID=3140254 RepID=A0AAV9UEX2_9PEZI
MGKVVWTADNDRKLLIRLIDKSAKSYNSEALCKLFEGATPKAIEERIAKLKREAKALDVRCAVQPSAPHKPKGNYYTAPPVPGQPYGGFKRTIAQVQSQGEKPDDKGDGGKAAPGKVVKKARTMKKKNVTKEAMPGDDKKADEKPTAEASAPASAPAAAPAAPSTPAIAAGNVGGPEDAKMETAA